MMPVIAQYLRSYLTGLIVLRRGNATLLVLAVSAPMAALS